jgi:tyrosyl-tRNA synthetase
MPEIFVILTSMNTNFVEELRWRDLLHDITPGAEELLTKERVSGYIGFDPTADSLHIGHLSQILTLLRFQKAGHKPIALVGGATGMVGDPSGKSAERNLLNEETLQLNVNAIKAQLEKFLDFSAGENGAILVNNYDWMKDQTFISFIRDVGKHISVNYMLAKDSVKNRLETGMSFTEFSYQLLQGNDFYHLNRYYDCKIQMGGSDQWGNITTGTELIRRRHGGEAFALTTQLIRKADGTKFGKTETGTIWLDRKRTSPYRFYQFWINTSDEDARWWIKAFTFLSKHEIDTLTAEHNANPEKRILQKALAKEITTLVHSKEDLDSSVEASNVLFNGGLPELLRLDETTFSDVFEGVPNYTIKREELESGVGILDFLAEKTDIFPSKGAAKKMIEGGGISLNKEKVQRFDLIVDRQHLIREKFIVVQKGKKNYFLCSIS